MLQTSGWAEAAPEACSAFEAAAARLAASGIALTDRQTDPLIEEVERAIADAAPLTREICPNMDAFYRMTDLPPGSWNVTESPVA